MKDKQLETILFESTIVDIDFSHWQKSVDLVILSVWDCFNDDIFPAFELKKISFKNSSKFSLNLLDNYSDEVNIYRGISVNNATIKKTGGSLHIAISVETSSLIDIVCSHYEIEKIEQDIQDNFMNNFKKHGKIEFLSIKS
ncbi:MAG: hypothetical protein Q4C98_03700 [Capnocytophaga sp.]|nr:hypothetical protein [Capnocytophaga sp.]